MVMITLLQVVLQLLEAFAPFRWPVTVVLVALILARPPRLRKILRVRRHLDGHATATWPKPKNTGTDREG